jgi:hypothetical protein
MLETPQERVKLLKAGFDGKTIEKLYLICNNFKIVSLLTLFEPSSTRDLEALIKAELHNV